MTLRCRCGGALDMTASEYTDDSMTEHYKCASCGRTGWYGISKSGNETTGGCVVTEVTLGP